MTDHIRIITLADYIKDGWPKEDCIADFRIFDITLVMEGAIRNLPAQCKMISVHHDVPTSVIKLLRAVAHASCVRLIVE